MADKNKKTQAQKAAASKSASARSKSKPAGNKTPAPAATADKTVIPPRLISSAVFLLLFILRVIVFFRSEGVLPEVYSKIVVGTVGHVGSIVLAPISLALFYIHAFSGSRPVRMRTVCFLCFLVCCGCIAYLMDFPKDTPQGFAAHWQVYAEDMFSVSGGFLCGFLAAMTRWLCGPVFCYILYILMLVLLLFGGMQITIPSIIRAIQNRPRLDWVEEEKKNRPDPASLVVNKIAQKQNAQLERRRIRQEQLSIPEVTQPELPVENRVPADLPVAGYSPEPVPQAALPEPEVEPVPEAAPSAVSVPEEPMEPIPETMPELQPDLPEEPPLMPRKGSGTKRVKVVPKEPKAEPEPEPEDPPPVPPAPPADPAHYCFPPIELLNAPEEEEDDGSSEMRENSHRLNETLASFKIDAQIVNVTRGPSVTRYDVELAKGVRLSKLTNAADDIALNLGAPGVRIAAVPGKVSVVGIEVPNRTVTTVRLREVIDSQEFARAKSKISFSVGKDISGSCIIGDIAKMPHMLIAGTTGSGKSVCTNSTIISILYKASPDEVKLIMVDPKMVELGAYNGIPHLLIPVVTDPKKAAGALQWAVTEMMRRYSAMSDLGVRDLESYNSIVESHTEEGSKLPQIVVIIDELADLMMVAAKEVEESICRIAQMGRASGIHLIIATQRPSSDVITGTMKANIPSRIAFAVASSLESRIILDNNGAETLVGRGDMLYSPLGTGKPRRVQGCLVTDREVEAVTGYVKNNYKPTYDQEIIKEIEQKANQTTEQEVQPTEAETGWDEMLPNAVDVILETGQASASMLQRRLKLGYARAARIVDEMEELKIVGPYAGSKPRNILITREQWQQMRATFGQGQLDFEDISQEESTEEEYPISDDDFLN